MQGARIERTKFKNLMSKRPSYVHLASLLCELLFPVMLHDSFSTVALNNKGNLYNLGSVLVQTYFQIAIKHLLRVLVVTKLYQSLELKC